MRKYVKCDNCGEEIPVGLMVFKMKGRAGIYCDAECFGHAHGERVRLTEDVADDCYKEVYVD